MAGRAAPHPCPAACLFAPGCQIRGIPGGRIEGHDYVAGITVRKNVNHKVRSALLFPRRSRSPQASATRVLAQWMRSAIENPRILILACPLEADRHGARLTSLDTLRIQVRGLHGRG